MAVSLFWHANCISGSQFFQHDLQKHHENNFLSSYDDMKNHLYQCFRRQNICSSQYSSPYPHCDCFDSPHNDHLLIIYYIHLDRLLLVSLPHQYRLASPCRDPLLFVSSPCKNWFYPTNCDSILLLIIAIALIFFIMIIFSSSLLLIDIASLLLIAIPLLLLTTTVFS